MPNYKIGIEVDTDARDSKKTLSGVESAVGDIGEAFGKGIGDVDAFGIKLGDLLTPTALLTAGAGALAGALVATGAHAMELATDVTQSTNKMAAQLDLTDEQAQGFQETMRAIYRDNFGTGYDDIAESLTAVEQGFGRIGGLAPAELQPVTENALALRDAFGTDVSESVSAAATLMENFGLTSTQAFDFITAGYQKGLDSSGDFLDSIGEYSVQFGQAGADAGQFFSILETGNAGGVLGTDKIADAYKEFSIRIVDNSTTTQTALESIGIDYDTLKAGFADGSVTINSAMQTVIDKINQIEDPVARNVAGVALFGTQWEDLTGTVLTQVDSQKTAIGDLEGAADSLNQQYDDNMNEIQTATREWNDALVDVGNELNELEAVTLPALADAMETFVVPGIGLLAQWIGNLQEGQNAWDAFINGLWGLRDKPPPSWGGSGSTPPASSSALSVQGAAVGGGMGGQQIYQQFYIERGDAETVQSSAALGVAQAQRMRGS